MKGIWSTAMNIIILTFNTYIKILISIIFFYNKFNNKYINYLYNLHVKKKIDLNRNAQGETKMLQGRAKFPFYGY